MLLLHDTSSDEHTKSIIGAIFYHVKNMNSVKNTIVGGFLASEFILGELIWLDYLAGDFTLSGLIRR